MSLHIIEKVTAEPSLRRELGPRRDLRRYNREDGEVRTVIPLLADHRPAAPAALRSLLPHQKYPLLRHPLEEHAHHTPSQGTLVLLCRCVSPILLYLFEYCPEVSVTKN